MEFKDYYKILGISPRSGIREIKSAYRRMANLSHPDKHPENHPDAPRFTEIREAWEVLKDPEKKREYDTLYKRRAEGDYLQGGNVLHEITDDDPGSFAEDILRRFIENFSRPVRPSRGQTRETGNRKSGGGHIHYDDLL